MTSTDENNNEINNPGYEKEGVNPEFPTNETKEKLTKYEIKKRNVAAVFGHGPGKFALIFVVFFIVIAAAFAYRQFTAPPPIIRNNSQVDVATAPKPQISVNPITPTEAARRAEVNANEAAQAKAQGSGYQPSFDPVVASPKVVNPPAPDGSPANKANVAINAGGNNQNNGSNEQSQLTNEQQAAIRAEKEALDAREKERSKIRTDILKQIGGIYGVGEGANGVSESSINNMSIYSKISYSTSKQTQRLNQSQVSSEAINSSDKSNTSRVDDQSNSTQRVLIKTSERHYAELDSELNTDDGSEVFATIRGGKWNGSSVIGKIVQQPNNVSIRFTILSPSDQRPTMQINAVALRIEDGKLGMADTIDNHTLSRYSALGFASLLGGAGKAYSQPVGTSVISNGQVITTTTPPTDRQIIGAAVGEIGLNAATEIRRGFDQPTTYKTRATKGFVLYFVQDALEKRSGN